MILKSVILMNNTYDLFSGEDLRIAELIQQRRLQMLVHSCLYYDMDTNLISDKQWDTWARELVTLQKEYPEISNKVIWYEEFKDWDASTGAFLPLKDPWVIRTAKKIAGTNLKKSEKKEIKSEPKKNKPCGQLSLF